MCDFEFDAVVGFEVSKDVSLANTDNGAVREISNDNEFDQLFSSIVSSVCIYLV